MGVATGNMRSFCKKEFYIVKNFVAKFRKTVINECFPRKRRISEKTIFTPFSLDFWANLAQRKKARIAAFFA